MHYETHSKSSDEIKQLRLKLIDKTILLKLIKTKIQEKLFLFGRLLSGDSSYISDIISTLTHWLLMNLELKSQEQNQ